MKKLLVILFVGAFSLLTCKKDRNQTVEGSKEKGNATIADKPVTPGDLVTLKFSAALEKEAYEISVGGNKVTLAKVADSAAAFIVPFGSAGVKTIDLNAVNTANLQIMIDGYTAVSDADMVKANFLERLSVAASNLPDGSQKDFLLMAGQTIAEKYKQLSSEEKKHFAFAINKLSFDPTVVTVPSATTTTTTTISADGAKGVLSQRKKVDAVNIDNEFIFYRETLGCVATTTLAGISLGAGAVFLKMPYATGFEKILGAALLAAGGKLMYDAIGTAVKLVEYKGIAMSLDDLIQMVRIENRSTEAGAVNNTITFKGGKNHYLKFTGVYNTMSKQVTIPILTSFIAKIETAVVKYNDIAKTVNNIKGFFSSTPAMEELKVNISQQPVSGNANVPPSLLTIENISDNQISLTRVNDENDLIVRASSNSITIEKAFTFDVVYTYKPFNINLRKTINAFFDGTVEPHKVTISGGNGQTGESGKQLTNPLEVLVTDLNNQPIADVTVDWGIKSGGGTVSVQNSKTNAKGNSSARWTLGVNGSQEVEVAVRKKDGSMVAGSPIAFTAVTPCSEALAPVITGVSFNCNSDGKFGVYVSFTSTGSDLMVGSGFGTCNLETNCYPSRLLIKDTVDPNSTFGVASNAYNAKLFSGTLRQGVIEFTFTGTGNCIPNKSAEEAFRFYYSRFLWKVQLMNHCNKRSEQVSF